MDENEFRKSKKRILTAFVAVAVLIALVAAWGAYSAYWSSFSTQKWLDHPERRAKMTADLFRDHELVGMSRAQIEALLGPDDNGRGYFDQPDRSVYYLGNERTIIDSEWLLIDFENDTVREYSMTTD